MGEMTTEVKIKKISIVGTTLPKANEDNGAFFDMRAGYAYILGGHSNEYNYDDILRFSVADGSLELIGHLPYAVNRYYSGWTGECFYILGGDGGGDRIIRYDPDANEAVVLDVTLPTAMFRGASCYDGSRYIYLLGGDSYEYGRMDVIYRFDVVSETVEELSARLPHPDMYNAAAFVSGKAYVAQRINEHSSIVEFDPASEEVRIVTNLPKKLYGEVLVAVPPSEILIIGGCETWPKMEDAVYIYDTRGEELRLAGKLPEPLATAGAIYTKGFENRHDVYLFGGTGDGGYNLDTITKIELSVKEEVGIERISIAKCLFPRIMGHVTFPRVKYGPFPRISCLLALTKPAKPAPELGPDVRFEEI